MAERGRFITLEGGEGAGKSTQLRRLVAALRDKDIGVVQTREPGGSPGAEEIRSMLTTGEPSRWSPMAETLLHFAARADHLRRTIRPALESGQWVCCDRFADSTMAYQGYGHGVDRGFIAMLTDAVLGGLRPDLTLVFDIPVEEGLARASKRAGQEDRYEKMDRKFHEALRRGFLEIAARDPGRCIVINAAGSEDETWRRVQGAVRKRLGVI